MLLSAGEKLGPYEILAPIGAGGMGEVYRARDAKLHRDVALKILPDAFAADPERLARFQREAQVLASLNHPHIAAIYGLEEAGRVRALVLELVEGPTVADRIAQGPIPLDEALPIARQIAEALEAAHEQGIIHRDLKPANIKLRPDGTVKVLDFGLAKALEPAVLAADMSRSPTITTPAMSRMGVILGTAAYMAPEQATGRAVDRRADVWAFGAVLHEMLTGARAFKGEDMFDTLVAVLRDDPDWSRLPANLPSSLRRLLRRCLEKDPKSRLSSMSDARLELDERDDERAPVGPQEKRGLRSGWVIAAAVAGAMLMAAATLLVWPALRSAPDTNARRLSALPPAGATLVMDSSESAISPDGRMLAFTTGNYPGETKLWVRPIDSLTSRQLTGTENGRLPFWSPDNRQLGFFADDKLKKISLRDGTIEVLGDAKDGRGASWSNAGVIVFAPSNNGPLLRMSANGGEPQPATTVDAARGETGHRFPWFLPDGRHFLFATLPPKQGNTFDIYVGSLDSPTREHILVAESAAVYAEPGYLLFARKNVLVAQPFEPRRLQLSGEPVAIGDAPGGLGNGYTSSRAVSVASTGSLAYLSDPFVNTRLVWFDRSGKETGTVAAPPGRYSEINMAPDGRRAAVVRVASPFESDIWIADLERGGATRFTYGPATNSEAQWSPDGSRIAFASNRAGPTDFFIKPASGASQEEPLFRSAAVFKDLTSWSADGRFIVFTQLDALTNLDLWVLPTDGDRTPKPYLRTPFGEANGAISQDGRWMAYLSDESGRKEIYVQSFPTPGAKYRVTSDGAGQIPQGRLVWWRADGKELLMFGADGRKVLVADVQAGAEFHAGTPRVLLTLPKGFVAAAPTRDFERLLVSLPIDENASPSLTVVLDWTAALRKTSSQ
jgi:Tol biopolymer transport system component